MKEPTPAQIRLAKTKGEHLITGLQTLVKIFMGIDFKIVLILSHQGKANSLGIMSDIDDKDAINAILKSAADSAFTPKMIDATNIPTEH